MTKVKTKKELEQELKSLEDRISELECTTDVNTSKISILDEIVGILNELPLGCSLINRAINRSKLRYLKHVVIPRRQKQILKIQMDESMPQPVKSMLIGDNADLLIKAKRTLYHREHFETKSSSKVRNSFIKLHNFLTKKIEKPKLTKGEERCQT